MQQNITINTNKKRQVIDLTDRITTQLQGGDGVVTVFIKHTTAALTTADLDPGTDLDLLDALENLIPPRQWRHPHNPEHAPDHLLASIIGPSITVPFQNRTLLLGTWQRIVLIEFDGPREREVVVSVRLFSG